jgi:hypothetical protein
MRTSTLIAPFLTALTLTFATAAAAAMPERPRECEDIAAAVTEALQTDYGYEDAKIDLDVEELCLQINELPSSVGFYDAALRAARSFIDDARHPESPVAIARTALDGGDAGEGGNDGIDAQARVVLKQHLALPTTMIRLMARSESPEGGESVDDAWIVELRVPTLSDHTYWAIVPRNGTDPVYNYGFN